MKRVSMSTTYTQAQTLNVSMKGKQNDVKIGITQDEVNKTIGGDKKSSGNQINCQLFGFDKVLLGESCWGSKNIEIQMKKDTYHKLRYRRDSKKQQINEQQNQAQTESNQQLITDIKYIVPINTNSEHHRIGHNTTQFSFITFSPYETRINSSVHKHQTKPSLITNTTLESFLAVTETHQHHPREKENDMFLNINNEKFTKTNEHSPRLSTLDSYRVKQNNLQQTLHSINPHRLQVVSKLCESIRLQQHKVNNNQQIQSIGKTMKNKQFIRSLKDSYNSNMKLTNQGMKYFSTVQQDNSDIKISEVCVNQGDKCLQINSIKTTQPRQNMPLVSRYKTLAQCGNTIVSLYNKSSQRRSRLEESSIVFQASKLIEQHQGFEKNRIGKQGIHNNVIVASDGKIVMRKCTNNKVKKVQNYQSFSEKYHNHLLSDETISIIEPNQMIMSINKPTNQNKLLHEGRGFLRSLQRRSFPLDSVPQSYSKIQFEEIKFDASTFIEYGPL